MTQPTLGLLDALRPPSGYRTAAVVGTTYSADLVTCMAVLTTLDGGAGDELRYGRLEALRALDRLRDKVRIYHHPGCVSARDGLKFPSLALLDRVLRPVRVTGRGSFHPKVWIVRQVGAETERYVLAVSSRNVTMATDWDLGIVLEGRLDDRPRTLQLPRVAAFAEYVLGLAGDATRLAMLGPLERVRWTRPQHVDSIEFDFQASREGPEALHGAWAQLPERPARALILSPFLDATMVKEAAARWGSVTRRRLVAGSTDLTKIALGSQREALQQLEPRQVVAASEAPDPDVTMADLDDEVERARALHAKVIALDDGRRGTVVLGSSNLTCNGWRGGSSEAFVRLDGAAPLCEALWQWVDERAAAFALPPKGTPEPADPPLDRLRSELQDMRLVLDERDATRARLSWLAPHADVDARFSLTVARYTTPHETALVGSGSYEVDLPPCVPALRTRFIACTLRDGDQEVRWIVTAEVTPDVQDQRDRELVTRLLSFHDFMAYLRSLQDDEVVPGSPEGHDDEGAPTVPSANRKPASSALDLEGLLRQLVGDPGAFAEMDQAVERYGELLAAKTVGAEEAALRDRFLQVWRPIREAFRR